MPEFKVGDRVKLLKDSAAVYGFEIGKIYNITEIVPGGNYKYKIDRGDSFWGYVNEEHIELAEPATTSEININSSGIEVMLCNPITNKYEELLEALEINQENYKNWFMGIWKNDKPIIEKKEGNDMLESLNLVDLYASKQKEKILKEENEKIEELKGKCEIINKFKALKGKFQEDCKNLYLSQFTEEEKEQILVTGDCIDDNRLPLRSNQDLSQEYFINEDFEPEGYETIRNEAKNKLNEIDSLMKTVKAHVGIAKTKEEVEEILTRYEILDKKGKLKI